MRRVAVVALALGDPVSEPVLEGMVLRQGRDLRQIALVLFSKCAAQEFDDLQAVGR